MLKNIIRSVNKTCWAEIAATAAVEKWPRRLSGETCAQWQHGRTTCVQCTVMQAWSPAVKRQREGSPAVRVPDRQQIDYAVGAAGPTTPGRRRFQAIAAMSERWRSRWAPS